MMRADHMSTAAGRRTMSRGMILLVLSSVLIISILSPLEPLDYLFAALSSGLNIAPEVFIMVIDLLLILAGYWLASSLNSFLSVGRFLSGSLEYATSWLSMANRKWNWKGVISLAGALFVIIFWQIPSILDRALLQYELHLTMHVSLLFAGTLIYVGFRQLTPNMRLLSYLLGCKAMAIFGAYLLISPIVIYGSYPYYEQAETGAAMVTMCVASDVTIIPLWLRRYFSREPETSDATGQAT